MAIKSFPSSKTQTNGQLIVQNNSENSENKEISKVDRIENVESVPATKECVKLDESKTQTAETTKNQITTPPITNVATAVSTDNSKIIETPKELFLVTKVVDGDTMTLDKIGTIRLIGINIPETVDPRKPVECFGKEASDKAKELLDGKKVYLEYDETQGKTDKYNRVLAYVFREDGLHLNTEMIKTGYAYEDTYDKPYKYQNEFKLAQKDVQNNELGLWSVSTCNGQQSTLKTAPNPTGNQRIQKPESSTSNKQTSAPIRDYVAPHQTQHLLKL